MGFVTKRGCQRSCNWKQQIQQTPCVGGRKKKKHWKTISKNKYICGYYILVLKPIWSNMLQYTSVQVVFLMKKQRKLFILKQIFRNGPLCICLKCNFLCLSLFVILTF